VDIWDLHDPDHPRLVGNLPVPATQLAFLPGTSVLATITFSGLVQLWDLSHPAEPRKLSALAGLPIRNQRLVVSPDGRTLAFAGVGSTTQLWEVANPHRPTLQATLTGGLPEAFDASTGFLAVLGTDGSVQLRDTDITRVIAQDCRDLSGSGFYQASWAQDAPNNPYQPCSRSSQ
jgi:WD40 repeat protein